jgi:flagellar biosynthesis/type III secretory pathway protein FliH
MSEGLKAKYKITKANGSPASDRYFVLKVDSEDEKHARACRKALEHYAIEIQYHLPKLADDLFASLNKHAYYGNWDEWDKRIGAEEPPSSGEDSPSDFIDWRQSNGGFAATWNGLKLQYVRWNASGGWFWEVHDPNLKGFTTCVAAGVESNQGDVLHEVKEAAKKYVESKQTLPSSSKEKEPVLWEDQPNGDVVAKWCGLMLTLIYWDVTGKWLWIVYDADSDWSTLGITNIRADAKDEAEKAAENYLLQGQGASPTTENELPAEVWVVESFSGHTKVGYATYKEAREAAKNTNAYSSIGNRLYAIPVHMGKHLVEVEMCSICQKPMHEKGKLFCSAGHLPLVEQQSREKCEALEKELEDLREKQAEEIKDTFDRSYERGWEDGYERGWEDSYAAAFGEEPDEPEFKWERKNNETVAEWQGLTLAYTHLKVLGTWMWFVRNPNAPKDYVLYTGNAVSEEEARSKTEQAARESADKYNDA